MLPITGPLTSVQGVSYTGAGSLRKYKAMYKQKKPFDRPLAYEAHTIRVTDVKVSADPGYAVPSVPGWCNAHAVTNPGGYQPYCINWSWTGADNPMAVQWTDVIAKAKSRFHSKVMGATAALGASIAERRQAMDMMTARLSQIYRFSRSVANFKWDKAAKELGLNSQQRRQYSKLKAGDKLRKGSKHFANNWLEFHFGWSPLIGDIHDAMEVLVEPVPDQNVVRQSARSLKGHTFTASWTQGGATVYHRADLRLTIGSTIRVSNPNLLLLNRLGVINPATVLWEIVPFSFVVDWFVNVNDFLEQFTEFAGVERVNPWYTYTASDLVTGQALYQNGHQRQVWSMSAKSTQRILGEYPSTSLKLRAPWTLSPTRGLTAAALLVQVGLGVPKSTFHESRVRTTKWPLSTDYFL